MERANSSETEMHRYQLNKNTDTKADGLYLLKIYEGIIYSQTK